MSIVKILAPITGAPHDEVTLATAFQAAKPFASHVDVLFVHRDAREAIPYSEIPLAPDIIQSIIDSEMEIQRTAAQMARRSFDQAVAEFGVVVPGVPWPRNQTTASYRDITGHLPGVLAGAANLSDLVVIPPITGTGGPDVHEALVRILTKVGRPVLLSARNESSQFGAKVAIGWDGRGAAAKALVAALPFLEQAKSVELIVVGAVRPEDSSLSDAREYLALHDIRCAERVVERDSRPIADALLDTARNGGFDLLVVGGYGHSRLLESIFGGVTESILSDQQLPIFMVH